MALEAEVLDHATPPASPIAQHKLGELISGSLTGLCLAFVAAGIASWAASYFVKAKAERLVET
jgi:hypothetical protein